MNAESQKQQEEQGAEQEVGCNLEVVIPGIAPGAPTGLDLMSRSQE